AFGNAKTAHNNNSSRFGKFIQVNYLESGIVRGAVVEKYLLEKSRLVSQEKDERHYKNRLIVSNLYIVELLFPPWPGLQSNISSGLKSSCHSASKNNFFLLILTHRNYHVFYYLLLGVSEEERQEFQLKQPEDYFYLNQHNLKIEDGEDLKHDFERLKQAMEMVGFLPATKKQIFSILSAILYLGNVTYKKKATGRDEGLEVGPPAVLDTLSQLLKAITARDSMAKSLYSALFDWIVLRINHALLNKKDMEESVSCLSIGVLDIFGFEDFERNSFEQFCINYANEQLQYYFNQHIFKLEQEEYQSEGISWHNIDYTDNVGCIHLISKKPTGLFYLLDEESNHGARHRGFGGTSCCPCFARSMGKTHSKTQHPGADGPETRSHPVLGLFQELPPPQVHHFARGLFKPGGRFPALGPVLSLQQPKHSSPSSTEGPRPTTQSGFPHATSQTLLAKFKQQHEDNRYFLGTPVLEPAFIIQHFAGKVKYQIKGSRTQCQTPGSTVEGSTGRNHLSVVEMHRPLALPVLAPRASAGTGKGPPTSIIPPAIPPNQDFREKNMDYMRPDIVALLRGSDSSYVRELIGMDPVAVFRWAVLRAAIQAMAVLREAGRLRAERAEKAAGLGSSGARGHLGELQRGASTPSEKLYRCSMLDFSFDGSEEFDINAFEDIIAFYESKKKSKGIKQKQIIPKNLLDSKSLKLIISMTLHDRTTKSLLHLHKKKKPPSISAQFQGSRPQPPAGICPDCSILFQKELCFDDELVLQQLRYTGMLETVRIRRSGYSAKYTFQVGCSRAHAWLPGTLATSRKSASMEHGPGRNTHADSPFSAKTTQDFTEQFQVLLPKNAQPCREVISALLEKMDIDKRSYQIGKTKMVAEKHKAAEKEREAQRAAREETAEAGPGWAAGQEPTQGPEPCKDGEHLELEPEKNAAESHEKVPSSREKRESRRQRGLEHVKLQNKHIQSCKEEHALREPYRRAVPEPEENLPEDRKEDREDESPRDARTDTGMAPPEKQPEELPQPVPCSPTPKDKGKPGVSPRAQDRPESPGGSTQIQRDVSKLLSSPSQTKTQPSAETMDGEPSTKKLAIQKKKSGDTSLGTDAGLSPGSVDSNHQHRHTTGEKHAKEPGGKGKKNRNLKIGKITVSEKWRESVFRKITNANELKYLDEFLLNKINDLRSQKTPIESLFIEATEKFRSNLKTMYSVPNGKIHVGYKDLMENYQIVVSNLAAERGEKDTNLVLNLFQSLLDEFTRGHTKNDFEPPKVGATAPGEGGSRRQDVAGVGQSKAQKKKRKQERAVMCKMTCHKKCVHKIQTYCSYTSGKKIEPGTEPGHFGVCVDSLTSDKLTGRRALPADPTAVKLENFPIHAITGVLKQWLRELPEPLMTFAQYGDFLRAVELTSPGAARSTLSPSTSTDPHPPRGAGQTCRFSLQIKNPKARMSSSGGLEELGVLPEEEVAGGEEDREKEILIERIQSIKEEKQDITYRLPELDPRGSDEENLDSETSASTESLLEERAGRGASEVKTPRRTPIMPTANIKLPPGLPSYLPGRAPGAQEAATPDGPVPELGARAPEPAFSGLRRIRNEKLQERCEVGTDS
ncbi:hypothetical protein E2I00_018654, partial [Balaenoptera physalus]